MLVRVCDVETTGMTAEDKVVELGFCDLILDEETAEWSEPCHLWSTLVNPGVKIPPEAMAVHHITDDMVKDAPPWEEAVRMMYVDGPEHFCAHNAKFEALFITPPPGGWLCTYRTSVHLAPNAPGWSNQVLRYWLKLKVDHVLASPPHRAGPDAYVTAHLLKRILTKATPDRLKMITDKPLILPKFTFGKWAMQPIEEIDSGYLSWLLKQDFDEDIKATAFHHLNLRAQDGSSSR